LFVTRLRQKEIQLTCKCFAASTIPPKFNFETFQTQVKEILSNMHDFMQSDAGEYFGILNSKYYKLKDEL
jgi:hypothetical protein